MDGDYISDLPAELKEKILVELPIKEVVRTSILSSKWKDFWTSIPILTFREGSTESKLTMLVDKVLLVHQGSILKFKFDSEHPCTEAIGQWMLNLSRNGIRDLELRFSGGERSKISSRLFSCLALERVDLSGCIINIPQDFQGFKLLRTLSLDNFDLTGISINNVVSSCPLLERLKLVHFFHEGCLRILAPNLKHLAIFGDFLDLSLQTPKLVYACICLSGEEDYKKFNATKAGEVSNITQVLGCLHNIEELNMGGSFIDFFDDDDDDDDGEDRPQGQTFWKSKATEDRLFKCLEIVNILYVQMTELSYRRDESMLEFAELVLSTAPVLEKMNIIDYEDPTVYSTKVNCLPKLPKKVDIVFVKTSDDDEQY
ncbi:F-box/RNI-like/FBD-like domains-containing protein [Rhynchospora pubera]|uniref:F-box/RNI-like/FBD-like domains-containing protein n=1 Tax=Rhynchospora pubera TaxID=906938 RepID=A0AAV8HBR1_9POAL|nr:F-box/RNI-like/FBD-like domains-containing protein [Rhynchospora pubera]